MTTLRDPDGSCWTTRLASSYWPLLALDVNRIALPPSMTCGQRCVTSPSPSCVTASGLPPAAETRTSAEVEPVARMIAPLSSHAPPRGAGASHSAIDAPPLMETFLSLPPAKYAIH